MSNLNVRLIVYPNCKLSAIDDSSYTNLPGRYGTLFENIADYVSLEFLVYSNTNEIEPNTLIFENYQHNRDNFLTDSIFPIVKDGVHYYYKIVIPKLETLFIEDTSSKDLYSLVYLKDQTFYYNDNFYVAKQNYETTPTSKEELLDNIDLILKESEAEIVTNYIDLYKLCGSQSFYCKKTVFIICKLTQCLLNLQRQIIDHNIYNKCTDYKDIIEKRDFILSTIYVLDYLKDTNNFQEAQRIIENVLGCNDICNTDNTLNNNCGCNG